MGRSACLALACALTACSAKPPVVLGVRMPSGCTEHTRSERCIGWIFDRMLMAVMFKEYPDRDLHDYIAGIGERLARGSGVHRHWTFRILDDDEPQAYSGFNSTIYITRGALAIVRDEAELAAIIGHEMGHTVASHNRETILDFDREVSQTELEQWRDLRYARDDEIQADELAVVYLGRAGYDTHAVERMLRALGAGDDDEDASDNRHPIFRERIARTAATAAHYPGGERYVERYNERVAKLVVGTDPRALATIDNVVVFAREKLAIDLPADAQTFVLRSMVIFASDKDEKGEAQIVGTIQLLSPTLAKEVKPDEKSVTETKRIGKTMLAVTIIKDEKKKRDYDAIAKQVVSSTRAPRDSELRRLRPMYFDPTKPRYLWIGATER